MTTSQLHPVRLSWDDAVGHYYEIIRSKDLGTLTAEDLQFLFEFLDLLTPIITEDEWAFVRDAAG